MQRGNIMVDARTNTTTNPTGTDVSAANAASMIVTPSVVMPAMQIAAVLNGYGSCMATVCREFYNEACKYAGRTGGAAQDRDWVIDCIRHDDGSTYTVEWRLLVTDIVDNDLEKSMTSVYNMVTKAFIHEKMFRGKMRQRVRFETVTTPSFMEATV